MKVNFLDGPARDLEVHFERRPNYIRVVRRPGRTKWDGWDVLDQLNDEPEPEEAIHVYKLADYGFACRAIDGKKTSGPFATYSHLPGIDGERTRDTQDWRELVAELCGEQLAPDGSPVEA